MHVIAIARPSVFTTHPQDQIVTINGIAVFECAARGSKEQTIEWLRDNEVIRNSLRIDMMSKSGGRGSTLTVKNVTSSDAGHYQCRATNADSKAVLSNKAEILSKLVITLHTTILSTYSCPKYHHSS